MTKQVMLGTFVLVALLQAAFAQYPGWQNNFNFAGDIDEVRISKVTRSADWIKLQYANQKPLQTAVGSLVPPGTAFSVTPGEVNVSEGQSVIVTAQAGGAQKVYWVIKRDGEDTVGTRICVRASSRIFEEATTELRRSVDRVSPGSRKKCAREGAWYSIGCRFW
jgi:hypothetical protein